MKINFSGKLWLSIGITIGLVVLIWATSSVLAQGSDEPDKPDNPAPPPPFMPPESADAPAERAGSPDATTAFTYQGLLEIDGQPVTGDYLFWTDLYDAQSGDGYLGGCSETGTGSTSESYVEDGVFTLYLICVGWNSDAFNGDGRWLDLWLAPAGTADWVHLTDPRQPVSPTPYAFSLFPGAMISGISSGGVFGDSVLNVDNDTSLATAAAFHARTATGSAVRGESNTGNGLYGYTQDAYAVYGYDGGSTQARGYGGYFSSANGVGVYGYSGAASTVNNRDAPGVYGRSYYGVGVLGYSTNATGGKFVSYAGDNIIEGWEDFYSPSYPQMRFKVTRAGNVYADGSYQSPAADLAELLPGAEGLEPGDVLAIGTDGRLTRSTVTYDTAVVGVHSTRPAFVGGVEEDGENAGDIPLAVVGIVPVKASAENGPIIPGDLLVSSSLPGHAMRAADDPPAGTVVGKALEGLDSGTGLIRMLVMLQ